MAWEDILNDTNFQAEPEEVKVKVAENYFDQNIGSNADFQIETPEIQSRVRDNFIATLRPPEPVAPTPGLGVGAPERTVLGTVGDIGISALKGAISLPQAVVGILDIPTGGYAGKLLEDAGYRPEEAKAILDQYLSPAQQAANKEVAEAEGFLPTIEAAIKNPSVIAHTVLESAPSMIGGAGVARGVLKVAPKLSAIAAAAIGESVIAGGAGAEQLRAASETGLLSAKEAAAATALGIGTGILGAMGGKIAQKFGFADVDTLLAQGSADIAREGEKGVIRRIIEGGISEGLFEEAPQSAQEQMWMNAAQDKPLLEGVGNQAAMGMLAGIAMGGGVNVFAGTPPTPRPGEIAGPESVVQNVIDGLRAERSITSQQGEIILGKFTERTSPDMAPDDYAEIFNSILAEEGIYVGEPDPIPEGTLALPAPEGWGEGFEMITDEEARRRRMKGMPITSGIDPEAQLLLPPGQGFVLVPKIEALQKVGQKLPGEKRAPIIEATETVKKKLTETLDTIEPRTEMGSQVKELLQEEVAKIEKRIEAPEAELLPVEGEVIPTAPPVIEEPVTLEAAAEPVAAPEAIAPAEEITEEGIPAAPTPPFELVIEDKIPQLDSPNRQIIEAIRAEVEVGEAGKRVPVTTPEGEVIGTQAEGSTFPEYFQDKGYKKKPVMIALKKALEGKKLAPGQERIVRDLHDSFMRARPDQIAALEAEQVAPEFELAPTPAAAPVVPAEEQLDLLKVQAEMPKEKIAATEAELELIERPREIAVEKAQVKIEEVIEEKAKPKSLEVLKAEVETGGPEIQKLIEDAGYKIGSAKVAINKALDPKRKHLLTPIQEKMIADLRNVGVQKKISKEVDIDEKGAIFNVEETKRRLKDELYIHDIIPKSAREKADKSDLEAASNIARRSSGSGEASATPEFAQLKNPADKRTAAASIREAEAEALRQFAEENDLLLPDYKANLDKYGNDGGAEALAYHDPSSDRWMKANYFTVTPTFSELFDRVMIHNRNFESTAYMLEGFTEVNGEFMAVFSQPHVQETKEMSAAAIEKLAAKFLKKEGFKQMDDGLGMKVRDSKFVNSEGVVITDIHGGNILYVDGDIAFIDPIIGMDSETKSARIQESIKPTAAPSEFPSQRVKIGSSPQPYKVLRELEATPEEIELGERFFEVENEKTGEVETVEFADLIQVKPRVISEKARDKAKANIKEKMKGLKAGVDPTLLADYAVIGAYHFESGLRAFSVWGKKMVEEFGSEIKPYLNKLWKQAKTQVPKEAEVVEARKKVKPEILKEAPKKKAVTKKKAAPTFTETLKEQFKQERKPPEEESFEDSRKLDAVTGKATKTVNKWVRRNFTKEGLLNKEAFEQRIDMEAVKRVGEVDIAAMTTDLNKAVAKAFGKKKYSDVSIENLTKVNEFLAGEDIDLPAELKEALGHMRAMLDSLSTGMQKTVRDMEAIQRGKLSTAEKAALDKLLKGEEGGYLPKSLEKYWSLAETIESNKGSYLNRSYQAFDDPKWMEKTLKKKGLIKRTENLIREENPNLTEEEVVGAVKTILQNAKESGSMLSLISTGGKLGGKDVSIIKKRKDIPDVIRELLGEYKDPKINFTRSASKMQYYIANHNFLMGLRKSGLNNFLYEKSTSNKGGDFVSEIASEGSDVMNPLNGLFTTEEFKQGLLDATDKFDGSELMRNVIRLNSMVKYGKTILAPTTQARNFISAAMFSIMNGHFNWSHAAKAFKVAKSDLFTHDKKWRAYLDKLIGDGVLHDNPFSRELKEAIKDFTEYDDFGGGPNQNFKRILNFFQKSYQVGDDFWKIIGYENEVAAQKKAGLSQEEAEAKAAQRIRDGYPTYSMVPRGIKKLRRWPLIGTFVSFPWEIVRTTKNQIDFIKEDMADPKTRPMAIKRMLGFAIASGASYSASLASMAMMGMDSDDDEAIRAQLPEWSRNSQLIYTGYDKDGLPQYMDLSFMDPYTYLKKPLSALASGNNKGIDKKVEDALREFLDPFVGADIGASVVGEVIYNQKVDGGEVYNEEDQGFDKANSIIQHLRKAVQPGLMSNIEKTVAALEGDISRSGKAYNTTDELRAWLGFRFGTLNLPQSMNYKGYAFRDRKTKSTRILNHTIGSAAKVEPQDIKKAVKSMVRARNNAYTDMINLVNGSKKLGVKPSIIAQSLRASGTSMEDIRFLLRGRIPRWRMKSTFLRAATKRALIAAPNAERRRELRMEMRNRKRIVAEALREAYKI